MPSPAATKNLIADEIRNQALTGTPTQHADTSASASFVDRSLTVRGGLRHFRIEFTANVELVLANNATAADGVGVLTLPAGMFIPLGARFDGSLTNTGSVAATSAEIALGTVKGSSTSFAAGTQNVGDGISAGDGNLAASTPETEDSVLTPLLSVSGAGPNILDGNSSALTIYLNGLATSGSAADATVTVVSGSILDIWGIMLDEANG